MPCLMAMLVMPSATLLMPMLNAYRTRWSNVSVVSSCSNACLDRSGSSVIRPPANVAGSMTPMSTNVSVLAGCVPPLP